MLYKKSKYWVVKRDIDYAVYQIDTTMIYKYSKNKFVFINPHNEHAKWEKSSHGKRSFNLAIKQTQLVPLI